LHLVTQALRPGLEISPPLAGLAWKNGSVNKLCLRCKTLGKLWACHPARGSSPCK